METGSVYLSEWRLADCDDGISFAILIDGNTVNESDVILDCGYGCACTFEPITYSRSWDTAPGLVSVDGTWGIPENRSSLPEGSQSIMRIVLKTNYRGLNTDKRYIYVVHLPGSVDSSTLPTEVCKYLINVDGSDAGTYEGTETSEWVKNKNRQWTYRKSDDSFAINNWFTVDEKTYYMDRDGIMLADTYAPDGTYVNPNGVKVSYKSGWVSDDNGWRYIQKNGYYTTSTRLQNSDGRYCYFNTGAYMAVDTTIPGGYRVNTNGVWDGQASTIVGEVNLGPGVSSADGWESVDTGWKFKQEGGTYVTSAWKQVDGDWCYFDENSLMATDQTTPGGYYVNADGVWEQ